MTINNHPLRYSELATKIEGILFRRALEKRLDGYTLATALEIAEMIVGAIADAVRHESPDMPKEYPEALINLIDALHDYIQSVKGNGLDLLEGGEITRAEYEEGLANMKPYFDVLKELEDQDIDPWLRGLIKDKL